MHIYIYALPNFLCDAPQQREGVVGVRTVILFQEGRGAASIVTAVPSQSVCPARCEPATVERDSPRSVSVGSEDASRHREGVKGGRVHTLLCAATFLSQKHAHADAFAHAYSDVSPCGISG